MRPFIFFLIIIFNTAYSFAQNVGIGTNTPNANAALEIRSTNKGFLTPRLSSSARISMTNVTKGMMVYDTTQANFYFHDGNKWKLFSEKNVDNLTTDYLSVPEVTANMSGVSVTTTAQSGILYDNGGPAGNYSNDIYYSYIVTDENNDSLVGYKVVIEQMSLAANDLLGITTADETGNITIISGTTTGTYYFPATSALGFIFQSDASGTSAGFRIRWSKVIVNRDAEDIAPAFGWYFNASRVAVRGGIGASNSWVTDSIGRLSFSYGANAKAKGKGSVALGSVVTAAGDYSRAFGYLSSATGDHSTAIGMQALAENEYAIALGGHANAIGVSSVAIGTSAKASGQGSISLGVENKALANHAFAFGLRDTASGLYSIAGGYETKATGEGAFAFGYQSIASGAFGFAGGNHSRAAGSNAFTYGSNNLSNGTNSVSFGLGLNARSYGEFVIGRYNKIIGPGTSGLWNNTDPLFAIANGTQSTPNNILTVFKNGRIGIGTDDPDNGFHIGTGSDASLNDGSGYMVIGNVNSSNLVFDNNEIVARNNGANNTLYLQYDGGALEIGGTAAKPGGGSWSATSDARLKKNVYDYKDGLTQLLKINPVYFNYNEKSGFDTSKQYIGILAQELKEIAPYMVESFKKDGMEYFKADNSSMTYMLINAVKEQQKMIELQQEQLSRQQKQIDEMKLILMEKLK